MSAERRPRRSAVTRAEGSPPFPSDVPPRDGAILLAVATLAYAPAVVFGHFGGDDFNLGALYAPDGGVNWRPLVDFLSCRSTAEYFYRPLGYVFAAGSYAVWGASRLGYFIVNVAVHALTGLCLWGAVRELGWGRGAALTAGAAFVLHPLHVEALWAVAGAYDLLAGLFASAALWAHVRWLREGGVGPAGGMLAGYALAVLGKEAAVTLPAVFAFNSAFRDRSWPRRPWGRHLALYGGLGVIAGGLLLLRERCLGRWVGHYPGGPSPADPIALLRGIPKFLYFMLVPVPWPGSPEASLPQMALAAVGGGLLIAAVLSTRRRERAPWAVAGTLVLALPILALVGTLERPTDLGRVFLLPAIGLGVLTGHSFGALRGRVRGVGVGALLLVWAILLGHYQWPLMARAGLTRHVLAEIEQAARGPGVSEIVIVGLPPDMFGPDNWAFARAAARPFADVPPAVSVRLASGVPIAAAGSTRILVWNPGNGILEARGPE